MKIVFIGGRDIHLLGGIESYMKNLSTQLQKMGHQPIIFCESDRNSIEWENGIKIIHQKSLKSNFICKPILGLKATIKTLLHEKNVDIIHYNAWQPSLWSFIPRFFGIKTLMQGHGLEWKRSKYSPTQQRIMKFMEWLTAHLNQNLIMCSSEQSKYFFQHYHKNATTISTAINLPNPNNILSKKILEKYNLKEKKYFLLLARLVKDKNPDYLIKAFNISQYNDYKLVIAGDNNSDKKYINYLHEIAACNPNIIFTGAVYGEDKESLLKNAYAFCIPSTIEGLAIALLEAMSYKIPIIASDIEANKEVLKNNATWCSPEDVNSLNKAIEYVINNPSEILKSTEENYNTVKNEYTWECVANKYIKYLESIGISNSINKDNKHTL